ncbi:diamine N-acetyltransferase [Clostridium collagenovorans DSM 3089]|uniref:Diamine N-acetyltransferase n=1 Tax=Clostridium collagenovorans DSM 3089 TaxID=1121306 RepID=A0A1M5S479_9CLOT|nr:GNAT family N-acetyltransferase [Clostridium collagenovorans]SHH32763.1 diamine N-acetyltransferase [Clostridium collagenovorans DSM 3089]
MGILLKKVTRENWYDCSSLEVFKEQEDIVAPNWNSIISSFLWENWNTKCIYDDDKLVGFMMYGVEEETKKLVLVRYMIDKQYQRKGLGKKALYKLFDLIKIEYGNVKFYVSVSSENIPAQKLYESVGFEKSVERMWDEDLMEIQL